MDRYEVMAGKMAPLTDGAHRKWGFTGKVETRNRMSEMQWQENVTEENESGRLR